MPEPSLYEWAGGSAAFRRLIDRFYDRVEGDPMLSPFFPGGVSEDHRHSVTQWWFEVFGGPDAYTREHGGYATMLAHHRNLGITAPAAAALCDAHEHGRDDAELPADPEFRAALVGYLEWGTRLALENSQDGRQSGAAGTGPALGLGRSASLSALTHQPTHQPRSC